MTGPPPLTGPPAGWHPDPWGLAPARWWDGTAWTGYAVLAPSPERPWVPPPGDRQFALRGGLIALLGAVAAVVSSVLAALFVVALGGSVHSLEALCASQAALWASLFGACVLAVRRHGNGRLRELGLAWLSWRQVGLGVLVGLVARFGASSLALALAQLFPRDGFRQSSRPVVRLEGSPLQVIVVAMILVVGAPFFEELFFRGLVQGAFTDRVGARAALLGQAVCFGAVHYTLGMTVAQAVVTTVTIGATGLVLGSLRWHAGALGPGMVAHATFNAFVVVAILVL